MTIAQKAVFASPSQGSSKNGMCVALPTAANPLTKNELPDEAEQQAADDVRQEEDGAKRVFRLERAVDQQREAEADNVADQHGDDRELGREQERIGELAVAG